MEPVNGSRREFLLGAKVAIAERDNKPAQLMSDDWDHGRPPNSALKQEPATDLGPKEQLGFHWAPRRQLSGFSDQPS